LDDYEASGDKIELKLAKIAQKRLAKKLKPDKLKGILEKYPRPENCTMKCVTISTYRPPLRIGNGSCAVRTLLL
jgi:hypothetical protein